MSRPGRSCLAFAAASLLVLATARGALAASIELSASTSEIYVGLPFTLSVQVRGFDENPEPKVSDLKIAGCDVTFLGMQPSVQSMIQIFGAQRNETRNVTFVYRYRVEPRAKGTFQIPVLVATQAGKEARSQSVQFEAREIAATPDMQIRLTLPDRSVWVGETFPITLDWYLKRNVQDQTFVVPIFARDDAIEVEAPKVDGRRQAVTFAAGAKDLELPFERGTETLNGESYTRFRFEANATATRPGVLDLEPARVVAGLEVGTGSDRFGFPVARTQLFKAEDRPRRLEVKPLPLDGRPASFRGAVGTGFTVEVKADRSVVRMGDPIKLEVTVHGHGRLEGLSLPPLDSEGGLPRELFSVPEDAPTGVLTDDGGKRFEVSVRVRSEKAREIPKISFSFFNPVSGQFETARSQPIALAVAGSAVVGADSVVSAVHSSSSASASPAQGTRLANDTGSLTGADLALSSPETTFARPLSLRDVAPLIAFFYAAPFLLLAIWKWHERTRGARATAAMARSALARFEERAGCEPSRSAASATSQLASGLQLLARELAAPTTEVDAFVERCERVAFDPAASERPLNVSLLAEAKALSERLARAASPGPASRGPGLAALAVGVMGLSALTVLVARRGVHAGELDDRMLAARKAYQDAMKEADRDRRVGAFARAEELLGSLAQERGRCPELLADWGSAALGAQDTGTAILAFRRSLLLDPGLSRARTNLAWLEARMPPWVPVPRTGALDSLAGSFRTSTPAARALGGAVAFAIAVLVAFTGVTRGRALRGLAVLPAVLSLGLALSLALDRDESQDAVTVRDGALLRSADSPGAPAVLPEPLPGGVELVVKESREGWSKVELASGVRGWLPVSALSPLRME